MKSSIKTLFLYVFFAVLASVGNFVSQAAVFYFLGRSGLCLQVALVLGTAVGLITKYALDKVYVFGHTAGGIACEGRVFVLYVLTGVVTTAIFWGAEWGAWIVFRNDLAVFVGGAVGLMCGYFVKYRLDRKFVFL